MKFSAAVATTLVAASLPITGAFAPQSIVTNVINDVALNARTALANSSPSATQDEDLQRTLEVVMDHSDKISVETKKLEKREKANNIEKQRIEQPELVESDDMDVRVEVNTIKRTFGSKEEGVFNFSLNKLLGFVTTARGEAKEASLRREEAETELRSVASKMRDLEDKYELEQTSLAKSQMELEKAKIALDTLEGKLKRKGKDLVDTRLQLDHTSQKVLDLEDKYESERSNGRKTREEFEKVQKEMTERTKDLTTDLTETETKLSNVSQILTMTESTLQETSGELNILEEERQSLRKLGKAAWGLSKERIKNRFKKLLRRQSN